uniref:Uncharacterized protein n=1 Tax=Scophthalmus maximus TaxID=52904 RepID=A0A8D3D7M2_SCOMX
MQATWRQSVPTVTHLKKKKNKRKAGAQIEKQRNTRVRSLVVTLVPSPSLLFELLISWSPDAAISSGNLSGSRFSVDGAHSVLKRQFSFSQRPSRYL